MTIGKKILPKQILSFNNQFAVTKELWYTNNCFICLYVTGARNPPLCSSHIISYFISLVERFEVCLFECIVYLVLYRISHIVNEYKTFSTYYFCRIYVYRAPIYRSNRSAIFLTFLNQMHSKRKSRLYIYIYVYHIRLISYYIVRFC